MNYQESAYSLEYTYAANAYSCISSVYPIHLMFAYLMTMTGIGAMVTRKFKPDYHVFFGRAYIVSTMWCIASSILIHTHGAQIVIIVSMMLLLASITAGLVAVTYHQRCVSPIGYTNIDQRGFANFWKNYFTAKNVHGALFLFSWWCGAGRVITHKPAMWQRCYTQPAFKLMSNMSGEYVPEFTESALPPLFALYTLAPAMVVILIGFAINVRWLQCQKQEGLVATERVN
jgi:hypothetical protein